MKDWIERNLPELDDWHLSADADDTEAEISYLFNDIGPLLYVNGLKNDATTDTAALSFLTAP